MTWRDTFSRVDPFVAGVFAGAMLAFVTGGLSALVARPLVWLMDRAGRAK